MSVKKIVMAGFAVALAAGTALPAFAASHDRDHGGMKGKMAGPMRGIMQDVTFVRLLKIADANKDGKISKDEMTAGQTALFTQIDANKDDTLTRGELFDFREAKREEFRKSNPEAAAADATAHDTDDGDKAADDNDRDDKRSDRRDHDRDRRDGRHHDRDRHDRYHRDWDRDDRGRHMGRWERRQAMMIMRGGGLFRMVDEDGNRKITKVEAATAGDKLFARMDANKDGTISIDDLPDRPF